MIYSELESLLSNEGWWVYLRELVVSTTPVVAAEQVVLRVPVPGEW